VLNHFTEEKNKIIAQMKLDLTNLLENEKSKVEANGKESEMVTELKALIQRERQDFRILIVRFVGPFLFP